jgi:hypothetical protein
MEHWTKLMTKAGRRVDFPGHPDYGIFQYTFTAETLQEFAESYHKDRKVKCVLCEKEVDYSTVIFTCPDCSK